MYKSIQIQTTTTQQLQQLRQLLLRQEYEAWTRLS